MSTELATIEENGHDLALAPTVDAHRVDTTDERNQAIAKLLAEGYKNASLLKLTKEESDSLCADFPDDAFRLGAGGKDNLLYIEHAYLRERLNQVLGLGAAVPVQRRYWTEDFTETDRDGVEHDCVRVYADQVLLIRGCMVGEAVGAGTYRPRNNSTDFSDALESAQSNALRRTCKGFGVGLQVWKKGFVEGWKDRNRGATAKGGMPKREKPADTMEQPKHSKQFIDGKRYVATCAIEKLDWFDNKTDDLAGEGLLSLEEAKELKADSQARRQAAHPNGQPAVSQEQPIDPAVPHDARQPPDPEAFRQLIESFPRLSKFDRDDAKATADRVWKLSRGQEQELLGAIANAERAEAKAAQKPAAKKAGKQEQGTLT
jgi:hypothetical protein